jgi:hypothetical protein
MPRVARRAKGTTEAHGGIRVELEAYLNKMQRRFSDVDYLIDCTIELLLCANRDLEGFSHMDVSPMVTTMMHIMRAHTEAAALQSNVLSILTMCTLGYHRDPSRNLFVRENGLEMLWSVMTKNESSIEVQSNAFLLLNNLYGDLFALKQATTRALLRAVLAALQKYTPPQQEAGSEEMVRGKGGLQYPRLGKDSLLGGRRKFVAFSVHTETGDVRTQEADEDTSEITPEMRVLRYGMQTLYALRSEMDQSIANASVDSVVKIMHAYPKQEVLQIVGAHVLSGLAKGGDLTVACMWEKGGPAALLAGMSVALDATADEGFDFPYDLDLLEMCFDAICLLYNTSVQKEEPGLTVLSRLIMKHVDLGYVVNGACLAIGKACRICIRNRQILGKKAIDAIFIALNAHKNDIDGMQTAGIGALANLVFEVPENCEHVARDERLRMLSRVLQQDINGCALQHNACYLFSCLTTLCMHRVDAMVTAGCLRQVVQAMREHDKHIECSSILHVGSKAIHGAIHASRQYPDSQARVMARLLDDGVADVLVQYSPALFHMPHDVLSIAFLDLRNILHACPETVTAFGLRAIQPVVQCVSLAASSGPRGITNVTAKILITGCGLLSKILDCARVLPNWRAFQDEFGTSGGFKTVFDVLQICNDATAAEIVQASLPTLGIVFDLEKKLPASALHAVSIALEYHDENHRLCTAQASGMMRVVFSVRDANLNHPDCDFIQEKAAKTVWALLKVTPSGMLDRIECMKALSLLSSDGLDMDDVTKQSWRESAEDEETVPGAVVPRCLQTHDRCIACCKTARDVGLRQLLKCSVCVLAPKYCSAACQKKSWAEHKAECKAHRKPMA